MSNDAAKPGHLFVCCACGKTSTTRYGFTGGGAGGLLATTSTASPGWDESCMLNANEYAIERLVWNADKTAVRSVRGEDSNGRP